MNTYTRQTSEPVSLVQDLLDKRQTLKERCFTQGAIAAQQGFSLRTNPYRNDPFMIDCSLRWDIGHMTQTAFHWQDLSIPKRLLNIS